MKPSLRTRLFVFILIGIILVGLFFTFYSRIKSAHSYRLIIQYAEGQKEILVDHQLNTSLFIEGPLGKTVIQIQKGKVWVSDSPCPDKVCMKMGKIPDNGGFIACLPNRVIIRALFSHD